MPETKRSGSLRKLLIVVVVLVVLGFLFVYSLETSRSEPYTVQRAHLETWTLTLEAGGGKDAPLLSVRTRGELVSNLFRQVFQRVMESMTASQEAAIPIVLRGEFETALSGSMTPDDLLAAAREARLESERHELRCLAHRRISEPRNVRQVYFVVVDSPAIVAFRQRLAERAAGAFDPAALTPIMFVGSTHTPFERWLPIRVGESECVAPIRVE
ncbi:MAG TPA: hypothetical protein VM364_17185 [Vicinamibacterales bacterium]|nr:hypothetical protein [Vicinamibacterales bacterium]